MSQPPTPYARQYNFAGWSVSHPTTPHQGNKLDQEYNALLATVNATISRLGEIQKDDGTLRLTQAQVEALIAESEVLIDAMADAAIQAAAGGSHTHLISAITGLQAALDAKASEAALISGLAGKAATAHSHAIADVTNLQTTLNGKAASAHTHVIADVTGLQTALDGKSATGHTHAQSDVTGLVADLAGKASATNVGIAKAWVSFDGTTTPPTIKSSHNVTSVSRTNTGVYVINFTAAFADANYCWTASARGTGASYYIAYQSTAGNGQTASALTLVTSSASAPVNCSLVNVAVFR